MAGISWVTSGVRRWTGNADGPDGVATDMRIDIWSEVACPWCYIGLTRFHRALDDFEHRDDVEVSLHSFQLDPTLPEHYEGTEAEYLAQTKGVPAAQIQQMLGQVSQAAAESGLTITFDTVRPANTWRAHRLLHSALAADAASEERPGQAPAQVQQRLKMALLTSHFTDGEVISDPEVLTRLAVASGMDEQVARAAVTDAPATAVREGGDELDEAVRADLRRAAELGITGVPFFVLDERYGVSGAQPVEFFTAALNQVWEELHPQPVLQPMPGLDIDPGASGPACGPQGCA